MGHQGNLHTKSYARGNVCSYEHNVINLSMKFPVWFLTRCPELACFGDEHLRDV